MKISKRLQQYVEGPDQKTNAEDHLLLIDEISEAMLTVVLKKFYGCMTPECPHKALNFFNVGDRDDSNGHDWTALCTPCAHKLSEVQYFG